MIDLEESFSSPLHLDNIDEEGGVIRNVKLCGKMSKNSNRIYTDDALKQAVDMYEGAPVFIDHSQKTRGLMEQAGVVKDVKWTLEGNYGDIHLYQSHPGYKLIMERAKRDPSGFGMSHHAKGKYLRQGGSEIIESIKNVTSVDIVSNPATTRGLFEEVEEETPTMVKTNLKALVESHGSADEKANFELLEGDFLEQEFEIEEGNESVKAGFGNLIAALHESESHDSIQTVLEAEKILKEGRPAEEPIDPPIMDDKVKELQEQLDKVTAENAKMKQEAQIKTLCESEKFKADDFQLEALTLMESAEQRVALIQSWKNSGRPERSGRREANENLGTYDEERAKLDVQ